MVTPPRKSTPLLFAGCLLALALAPAAAPRDETALSAPVVTFACTPEPADCTGWYTTNVTVRWNVDAAAIQTIGCNTDTITVDTKGKDESCHAVNAHEQWTRIDLKIKVDKTPPTITGAAPDRQPDVNGWYNHPLSVAFQGADATSGLAGCSVSPYAGPASPTASVAGTCRDNAGNTSPPEPYSFKYAADPPTIRASSSELNEAVVVRWAASSNTQVVSIHRTSPSTRGKRQTMGPRVYEGAGSAFRDTRVRNGISYLYTVFAISRAGLVASAKVEATPTPLFSPAQGAPVRRPPLLRWAPVRGATYYNVQLRRNGKKILSRWPRGTSLQLHWQWRFQGRRYRLAPGRYHWYVWPGLGSPVESRYGGLLGHSTFTVEG
jgi:hypothetical protein